MKPTVAIPRSHLDLLERSLPAVLATVASDGFPRAQPVGCGFDGTHVSVTLSRQQAEAASSDSNPPATVLVVDPQDTGRWIEIRGDIEEAHEGPRQPAGRRPGPGATAAPGEELRPHAPVVWRIRPTRVNLDAVHR